MPHLRTASSEGQGEWGTSLALPTVRRCDERRGSALAGPAQARPEGTAQSEPERWRDKAIQPFLDSHAQREKRERLIEDGLREIYPYLQKLEQEWEFDKSTWTLEQDLKPAIRKQLAEELSGSEPEEQVKGRVRRLVREELEL